MENNRIFLLDTPRDAMQGLNHFIPTREKVKLLSLLLKAGFDVVDLGSLASVKVIPQFSDFEEVLTKLPEGHADQGFVLTLSRSGIDRAVKYRDIRYVGFPFSPSAEFLKRNIRKTPEQAAELVDYLIRKCSETGKTPLVYLSMAFDNPYNETITPDDILRWAERFYHQGARYISLSDILGQAEISAVAERCRIITEALPEIKLGLHLHVQPGSAFDKLDAAYANGVRFFEGVTGGAGGCPMTGYEMVRNISTRTLIEWAATRNLKHGIDEATFKEAENVAIKIFSTSTFQPEIN
ncbi:MAG: hydroxymethylglutaryl-CoA lyase [Bacteroidales bacterium]